MPRANVHDPRRWRRDDGAGPRPLRGRLAPAARGRVPGRRRSPCPRAAADRRLVLALRDAVRYDVAALGVDSPTRFHLFAEIFKHAFADRARISGDPAFDPVLPAPGTTPLAGRLHATHMAPGVRHDDTRTERWRHLASFGNRSGRLGGRLYDHVNTVFGAVIGVPGTGIVLNNEIDDFRGFDAPNVFGLAPSRTNRIAPGSGRRAA